MTKPSETPPAAPPSAPAPREKRWSARRKTEIVIRLLKGESLDALSRETGQLASRISAWRDEFLSGGENALKSRSSDSAGMSEAERRDLQAKIGEITMDNELLRTKIAHLEAGLPPAQRRSRR